MMQETHLAALQSLDRFTWRKELSFFFWLCEIARRLIANHQRKATRDVLVSAGRFSGSASKSEDVIASLSISGSDAMELVARREHVDLLALGLSELSEKRRHAIVLRYIEGLSNEEAAAQTGVSSGAFRVTLSRALVDLRAAVARFLGE
jgi:RNA polymerase sigma factor (sigma-70 family)